jgi:DNA invertase Pin-like site-specific DNA recombinase
MIYRLLRYSSQEREAQLTVEVQMAAMDDYLRPLALGAEHPEPFVDRETGCYFVRLTDRPQGGLLNELLRDGDVVVAYSVDRCFRHRYDAIGVIHRWEERGIAIRFVLPDTARYCDPQRPVGRGSESEWDLRNRVSRAKEGQQRKWGRCAGGSASGRPETSGRRAAPYGYKIVGKRERQRAVIDVERRKLGVTIVYWHDYEGVAHPAIADRLEKQWCDERGLPWKPGPQGSPRHRLSTYWSTKVRRPRVHRRLASPWTRFGVAKIYHDEKDLIQRYNGGMLNQWELPMLRETDVRMGVTREAVQQQIEVT